MFNQIKLPASPPTEAVAARLDRLAGSADLTDGLTAEAVRRLEAAARLRSIAASLRLSGVRVAEDEVAAALARGEGSKTLVAAVQGYATGLDFNLGGPERLIATDDLRRLNAVVSGGDPASLAGYREHSADVESFDTGGRALGRVIPTLPPRLIAERLEDLVTWFELESRGGQTHPVTAIATFTLGLLAINPFERANGRTTRLAVRHLLARAGYRHVRLSSLEAPMEELREAYYEAYDRSQMGIWAGDADLAPWLGYFAEVLDRQRSAVEAAIRQERTALELSPLQQAILEAVRGHGIVDAALLIQTTGANRNTLKDNLRRLVDRGLLERIGQRRGTRYRLPGEAGALRN